MTIIPVYIFDIDGTCSDHSHRLHWLDAEKHGKKMWDEFHEGLHLDPPMATCDLAKALMHSVPSRPVIFMTGRMENQRDKTREWLGTHVYPVWKGDNNSNSNYRGFSQWSPNEPKFRPDGMLPWLLMRAEGDKREGTIVKGEMLDMVEAYLKVYQPHWKIAMAFEDRPRICDLWRERGLTVAKIGDWEEINQASAEECWSNTTKKMDVTCDGR